MTFDRNTDMDLPSDIPIFPLPNALLLPEGQLPLNIFEPRYLAMIEDALGSPGRLIGMVQPVGDAGDLFDIGCAGRISYFQETGDGRFMIALNGVCRFRLAGHHLTERGYRRATVSWDEFISDLENGEGGIADRDRMFAVMRRYFDTQALLEAEGVRSRADLLIAMMEMALHGDEDRNDARH
jgi:Lon protease-like protein